MERAKALYEELEKCDSDERRLVLLFDLATTLLNFDEKRNNEVAEEIKALAEKMDSYTGRSYYHSSKGRMLFKKSKFAEAAQEFDKAVEMAQQTDNQILQAACLDSLGIVYCQAGEAEKALEASTQALGIFKQLPNTVGYQLVCFNNIGNAYKRLAAYDKAEQVYLEGLALAKQDNDPRMEANLRNNLCAISLSQEKYQQAMKYIAPAIPLFKASKHKHGEVHATVFLGHCYLGQGEYAKAMEQYVAAQRLLRDVDHKPIESQLYKGLGDIYTNMGALQEANKNYQKGLSISTSINDVLEMCDLNIDLVKTHIGLGDKIAANTYYNAALQIAQQHNFQQQLQALHKLKVQLDLFPI